MTTYKEVCKFHVGDLVTTKLGYGYKLFDHGTLHFTRTQTSGIVLPADGGKTLPVDVFGTVYISIAAGIKAAVSLDGLE